MLVLMVCALALSPAPSEAHTLSKVEAARKARLALSNYAYYSATCFATVAVRQRMSGVATRVRGWFCG